MKAEAPAQGGDRMPRLRWLVCGLLFLATVIGYIDRQTVSVTAPVITKQFSFSNAELGRILGAFLLAYTAFQLLAGRLFDRAGAKLSFGILIALWSAANIFTAFARRAWHFSFFQFLLGTGESGNYPGGVKVLAEWFPPSERAFAGGLFTSGASIGAVVAGPLIGAITHYWGWRAAFILTGALGFVWLVVWLSLYDPPARHRMLTEGERELLAGNTKEESAASGLRWVDLFRFRQVWALTLARFFEEPILWLVVLWLPKYIVDVRGLTVLQTGWLLSLPFIALDLGYIGGGWATSALVRRNYDARTAQRRVMLIAAILMLATIPAVLSDSVTKFTVFLCAATLGHGAWFSNVLALPAMFAPHDCVASVYGISSLGGGTSALLVILLTGVISDKLHTFAPVFIAVGIMPVLGYAALVILGRDWQMLSPQAVGRASIH